jgi:hypothetical protein
MHFLVPVADSKHNAIGVLEIEKMANAWYKVTLTRGVATAVVYVSPHDGRRAFCDRSAPGG